MNRQIGPYQLVKRLGVGGMAEVFLANARREGECVQPCVLKVLHREIGGNEQFVRMLLDEARIVARLRHNNIASLYDVGRHDDQMYLVMEYVAGRDLHSILMHAGKQGRSLPIEFAVHVAQRLCNGLHFAHTRLDEDGAPMELVHRDVSPPNVLVSTLGEIKLIDFGVAKFNSELRQKTQTGVIKGKFGYMSPEQARDDGLDRRSDIFAVGVCLYEMLTGRALYGHSDDPTTMLERARNAQIAPVRRWREEIPEELAEIIHRALETDPDDRYQWAHHMQRELAAFLSGRAPDYTALDAGEFVDELFELDDPALGESLPRLEDNTLQSIAAPQAASWYPEDISEDDDVVEASYEEARGDELPATEIIFDGDDASPQDAPSHVTTRTADTSGKYEELDATQPKQHNPQREYAKEEDDFAGEQTELLTEWPEDLPEYPPIHTVRGYEPDVDEASTDPVVDTPDSTDDDNTASVEVADSLGVDEPPDPPDSQTDATNKPAAADSTPQPPAPAAGTATTDRQSPVVQPRGPTPETTDMPSINERLDDPLPSFQSAPSASDDDPGSASPDDEGILEYKVQVALGVGFVLLALMYVGYQLFL